MDAIHERPVIFNGEMVRAILDGRKTQTRRVIKPFAPKGCQGHLVDGQVKWGRDLEPFQNEEMDGPSDYGQWWRLREWSADWHPVGQCPYGQTGDRLWVRETWQYVDWTYDGMPWISYKANGAQQFIEGNHIPDEWCERLSDIRADLSVGFDRKGRACDERWRPSIHMPRWASRILLEITDIRVERVRDIKPEDAIREGYPLDAPEAASRQTYIDWFIDLWDSINAKRGFGWDRNPWCWVVEFKVVQGGRR